VAHPDRARSGFSLERRRDIASELAKRLMFKVREVR